MDVNIAVVIPLYNKAESIRECVESVLCQSFTSFEVIVVDDGSTDLSCEVVGRIIDDRIKVVRQENKGVSLARNRGLAEATAEYVAFLDADDAWLPSHLEVLSGLVNNYPEVDVWATGYVVQKDGQEALSSIGNHDHKYSFDEYIEALLAGTKLIWTSAAMVRRRAALELDGFMVGYNHGEDHALWLSMVMQCGGVAVSGNVTSVYRDSPGSLTKRLVTRPDACMDMIDDILQAQDLVDPLVRQNLMELKYKFSLAHAIGALMQERRDVAVGFLALAKGTELYTMKRLLLRILVMLDGCGLSFVANWVFGRNSGSKK